MHIRLRSTHFPLLLHLALVETASNSLLFGSTSDSSLAVQLHPLVILTTSDYTTCHHMRSQQGSIVGAIIGWQSMEQAFQCKTKEQGDKVLIDEEWFTERLEQFKDVQKSPPLDLVVICFLDPPSGPLTGYPTTRIIISLTKAFKPPCQQVFSSLSRHAIPGSNFDPPTTQMQKRRDEQLCSAGCTISSFKTTCKDCKIDNREQAFPPLSARPGGSVLRYGQESAVQQSSSTPPMTATRLTAQAASLLQAPR
ncbi:hypothetical protein KCU78_g600, partial [Aureobasidium melanogenum]